MSHKTRCKRVLSIPRPRFTLSTSRSVLYLSSCPASGAAVIEVELAQGLQVVLGHNAIRF